MNNQVAIVVGAVGILLGLFAVVASADFRLVGEHTGYSPEQPIPYSHQLHAGKHEMQCLYCHFGAERSRHAGIPPTSVCMNCHEKMVLTASPLIAKLQESYTSGKPMEWVKIHNLPDFVYFSHASHVGKNVACETCHGNVAIMTKVQQESDLSMGWCINCHRDVNKNQPEEYGEVHAPENCSGCHR
ncbi:MAG: cytochrome c family protein [Planctomycetes bacterium]|nr:cytochrome c family protein [Planctomycetota bacterium]